MSTVPAVIELVKELSRLGQCLIGSLSRRRERLTAGTADYLDEVSETLARAALAVGDRGGLAEPLGKLRYYLDNIEDALRYGDPRYRMGMEDHTVIQLRRELERLVKGPELQNLGADASTDWEEVDGLRCALLEASGMYRAAALSVRLTEH